MAYTDYEFQLEYHRQWRDKNRDYYREYYRNYNKKYRRKSKTKTLNQLLSDRLRQRLYYALKRKTKKGSAVQLLGISVELAIQNLENKFLPGMNWSNWGIGKGKWHIDHIKPLSSFDLTDINQLSEACHINNLQPLWSEDNIRKNNK